MKKLLALSLFTLYSSLFTLCEAQTYNYQYSIACHNCYEPKYTQGRIEDVFPYTTTIEIDIWDSQILSGILSDCSGAHRMNKNWYVKHLPQHRGNFNCCGGTFRDCLEGIKRWSDSNSNHKVITIFLDKEENWSDSVEGRSPVDLDELLLSIFTKAGIFSPANLLNGKASLKEAVPASWPPVDSLKGRFIFVITDPHVPISRTPLNKYLEARKDNAVCFVAPHISNENGILCPRRISPKNWKNVVFYNLKYADRRLALKINSEGFISRLWGAPETEDALKELIKDKVNFVAMHNYKI